MGIDLSSLQDTSNGLDGLFGNPTPAQNPVQLDNNNPQGQQSFWDDMTNTDEFSAPESDYQDIPEQTQPTQEQQQNQNDAIRYQYFQSEADRAKTELAKRDKELAEMKYALSQIQQSQQQQQQQQQPVQEEMFPEWNEPEPPLPTDPNDVNALYSYINAKNVYDNKFKQYMSLRTQWIDEKSKERVAKTQEQLVREQQEQMQRIQMQQNISDATALLQQKYGATREQANEFISFMSNNDNFNLENMWKLYSSVSMNQQPNNWTPPIQPNNYMPQQPAYGYNPIPSQQFQQFRQAQSIPQTVGVFSQNQQQTNPVENWFNNLISQANKKTNFKF